MNPMYLHLLCLVLLVAAIVLSAFILNKVDKCCKKATPPPSSSMKVRFNNTEACSYNGTSKGGDLTPKQCVSEYNAASQGDTPDGTDPSCCMQNCDTKRVKGKYVYYNCSPPEANHCGAQCNMDNEGKGACASA